MVPDIKAELHDAYEQWLVATKGQEDPMPFGDWIEETYE